ncbi:MAG: hypothetical protein IT243_00410 [Bacteroidia bacterium]|nr:hypothetical protein [Bacteroidia bacterium]
MKLKIIAIAILALIALDSYAYTLIIHKTKLDGDGTGNYNYINRYVVDNFVYIEGVPILQSRTVNITCQGPGGNACPNNIAGGGGGGGSEQPNLTELFTEQAINAAQALLNKAEDQSSSGGSGNDSGTIVTPDGRSYHFSVSWSTVSGETSIDMTFEDAL